MRSTNGFKAVLIALLAW